MYSDIVDLQPFNSALFIKEIENTRHLIYNVLIS